MRNPWCIRMQLIAPSACLLLTNATHADQNELEGKSLYDLSKMVSDATGYTIVFSPRVRLNQDVEIYSDEGMSGEELFRVYQTILGLYGYAAVRNGNTVRIVRERKARSMPLPVISESDKDE